MAHGPAYASLRVAAALVWFVLSGSASAGSHRRVASAHGPIHIWTPDAYDAASAGVVVYIHGYFTSVDRAWREHHLARQFDSSGINAMFIACSAPDGWRSPVRWKTLDALLTQVANVTAGGLPGGRIVVVGHSGAHRTIEHWLAEDSIDTIVLVDALYGDVDSFKAWIDASADRRLIDAAAVTRRWSDQLHALLPDTLVFEKFPSTHSGHLDGARDARVVYVHSQLDHMELVTSGRAIPMLLRAVALPMVTRASRSALTRAR